MKPQPEITQPTTASDIQNIEFGENEAVSTIRYSGDNTAVTIRARWQEEGGRPVITHAEPVG